MTYSVIPIGTDGDGGILHIRKTHMFPFMSVALNIHANGDHELHMYRFQYKCTQFWCCSFDKD